jgi:ABC-type multidrug transport system ATPase subunit
VNFFITTHYMDEAERCTHVGYIHFGQLIVSGTPAELKKLPELQPEGCERFEVRCAHVADAMILLEKLDAVHDATIFGDSIHVLADAGSEPDIRETLTTNGFTQPTIRTVPPTLEDVFVTLTRQREAARV